MSPTVTSLLARLAAVGIRLRVEDGDRLRYRAPKGALSSELAAEIKSQRDELITHLTTLGNQEDQIVPLPPAPHYALSQAQWRLWVLMQMQRESTAYNVPLHLDFKGPLDPRVVAAVFNEIIGRHEALRTNFVSYDDEPRQVVHPPSPIPLEVVDLSNEFDAASLARDLARQQTSRPFDLAADLLIRIKLVRLAAEHHVLLLTLHHIVMDGTSFGVLLREFGQLYAAFAAGSPSPLSPLPLQYRDYAAWQNARLHHPTLVPQGAYWRKKLGGEIPVVALPADFPRPAALTHHGHELTFEINAPTTTGLNDFCRQEGATLFMGLVAAVKLLLHRYTGQTDLIVGSPIAGRTREELQDQVGFYINTLALRTQINPTADAQQLLAAVRSTITGAFDHQDYPFDFLVNELNLARDQSRSPLFDVMVTLQNQDETGSRISDLSVESFLEPSNSSKVDLTFYFKPMGNRLRAAIEYNADIYAADRIERMAEHLQTLLQSLPTAEDLPVSQIPLLSERERDQVLREFNPPPVETVSTDTIVARFEAQVTRAPNRIALTVPSKNQLTYAELNERANRLSRQLIARGVTTETPVGLLLERSSDLIVAMLSILKAGGAYLPIDPIYPNERIKFILEDAQAPVVITSAHLQERLTGLAVHCLLPEVILSEPAEGTNLGRDLSAESAAYIIYTSGSTGVPKGCVIPHEQVVRLFDATSAWFNFGSKDVWTLFHSPAFDFSVWEIWGALLHGGRLVMVSHDTTRDPEQFWHLLREERVTVLNQTPSAFQQLAAAEELLPAATTPIALRTIIFAGEALDIGGLRGWWDRHGDETPRLVNMYGITETTVHSTYRPVSRADLAHAGRSVIGEAIPDLTLYLLDANGEPVPIGIPGEIHVGGRGLARGYLNRPELTAARFIADPFSRQLGARLYRSGDLARWLPDGDMEYLGRADDQVKVRGFRIELGEIETKLTAHPAIANAHVLARTDAAQDQQLIGYFTVSAGATAPSPANLREHLSAQLPDYMVPAVLIEMENFPLTANGKVDRRALPPPETDSKLTNTTDRVAPRNPTEEALTKLWQEVLELAEVGVTDSFFELGGHSLKAVRIVARARKELGYQLTIADLFSHPTIEQLAAKQSLCVHAPAPAPSGDRGALTLSVAQRRLWILEQMRPGTAAFTISGAWTINGPLDYDRWDKAWQALVIRHDALRSYFVAAGEEVIPRELEAATLGTEHFDCSDDPHPMQQAVEQLEVRAAEAFDLSQGPLFRMIRFRLSDQQHLLLLSLHHIVSDGWSMELIMREFSGLYNQEITPAELPPATPYRAFAQQQNEGIKAAPGTKLRDYWSQKLAAPLEALNMPTDFTRPKEMTAIGQAAEFRLPGAATNALKSFVAAADSTVFMGLVTLIKTLLHRYTGQTDLTVGSPVAGREDPAWEHTVGFFINTIVIRDEIDPDGDVHGLLQQVRQSCLESFAHQAYPFDQLVDDLQLERDLSRHPLFDVSIQHRPREGSTPHLQGLSIEPLPHQQIPLKCDLSFDFGEEPDGLVCSLTYNPELFSAERIERMGRHLSVLAEAMFTRPENSLADLPLLGEAEYQQVCGTFANGAPQAPAGKSLSQWFEEVAQQHPEQPALVTRDHSVSYIDLHQKVNALAGALIAQGLKPGEVAGVMLERDIGLPIAMLAILRVGAIYLPLDPVLPAVRREFLVSDGQVKIIITSSELRDRCPAGPPLVEWAESSSRAGSASALPPFPSPPAPAYLIYTSGSTGQPKGVLVSHQAYANTAKNQHDLLKLKPGERTLQFANSSFDASVFEILGTLLSGAALVLAPPEILTDPARLPPFLREYGVTFAVLPPSFLRALDHADLSLRVLLTAGESAVPADACHYADRLTYLNGYGPTEAAVWNTMEAVQAKSPPSVGNGIPIGRPLAGTQLFITDSNTQPVPIGVDGEICIGGLGLAEGYWQRDLLTRQAFVAHSFSDLPHDRLYRTGDIGRWLPDGRVVFVGRRDGQIKLRGHRIETEEVAQALQTHPEVHEAVVILRQDRPDHPLLTAYYRLQSSAISATPIREFLTTRLPSYMIPDAWVAIATWPLTPAGKIDRRSLPAPDVADTAESFVAPRDEVEQLLSSLFAEVLGIKRVGIHDRFFRLGGNSLLALRAVTRIREALRVDLSISDFFTHASVEELGQILRQDPATSARVNQIATARAKLAAMTPAEKKALLAARSNPRETR